MIRFGSVCSGIEAASVAWHPLGWRAAWLSEIEQFPSAVLNHHYPDVPNLGDMTALPNLIELGLAEAPDVFCGGTPCQAFSVAGLRKSLDDARGNLSLTFCEIANAIDNKRNIAGLAPAIIFWENVPGVLNTKDNAFGCFLGALAGEDEPIIPSGDKWTNAGCVFGPQRTVAWRVLDAQYFGVAQRRRRVFVVASARDDFDPAEVLFESESLRRDTAPSRKAGQAVAPCVTNGPPFSRTGNERVEAEAMVVQPFPVANTLTARMHKGMNSDCNEGQTPVVSYAIQGSMIGRNDNAGPQGDGINEEVCFTQNTIDRHAVAQPIPFGVSEQSAVGHCLRAGASKADKHESTTYVAQPVGTDCYNGSITGDVAATMGTPGSSINASGPTVMMNMAVRRLTPIECERLQGFPDGYTNIPWRNKPESPDGPRYKALGNSWAVPVVRWIGKRINEAVKC